MTAPVVAAVATRRRRERDAADPVGAVARNHMRALVSVVLSSIWVGAALIVVAIVSPAAFRVLPTRALAGALVGEVLPVLFVSGLVIGTAMLMLTPRGAPKVLLRRVGAIGTIVGCAVAQVVIGPRISALRVRIGPSVDALAASDPLRVTFGKLHALSVLSLGIAMVFALVALVASMLGVRAAYHED